jgi:CDP-4-dehydro-6-deoxyglucose reductase, E3
MKIYINPQHTISGDSTKTIFESAKLNGLTLNHSCLKGRCSECKVQIVKGQYYMPDNQEGLTDKEVD